jgi:DNA-binding response OmpR family regulator
MKVLWVEDHQPVRDMLAIAADKAARARVPIDLVTASTLMEAEARLRLERFDLVMLDLTLPDSHDGDMTIARIANMGKHRIAVCSAQAERDEAVAVALRCGCNIAPQAVFKANLPFNRFIQRAESFLDFLLELMPGAEKQARVAA